MTSAEIQRNEWKKMAGEAAADLVEDGMCLGIGSGSTAEAFIRALGRRVQAGLRLKGAVATSLASRDLAAGFGISCADLECCPDLDLYIDGADEIDSHLQLIKGAGGALLHEKIVATAARRFVVIGDVTKQVAQLGHHAALPVETIPFALTPVRRQLEALGAVVQLRQRDGNPFLTENQNVILDCTFPAGISDAPRLDAQIHAIVGVVETGLFLNMAQQALIAGPEGVLLMKPPTQSVRLEDRIRDIPDFPHQGILFKDITPLLQDSATLREALDRLAARYKNAGIEAVVGIESRGFIFGAPLAYLLNCGFVPVRKFGKLPSQTVNVEYALEYGSNIVEIHLDAIKPGQRVLIVDDLLATGGTVAATIELVERLGGQIAGIAFLVELNYLKGRERLKGQDVFALINY
jgi:ribose 5-phosphate isomerase/adenine phosphoribosyltransferase